MNEAIAVSLIGAFVTIFGGYITYQLAKLNGKQALALIAAERAAAQADAAAEKVETVRTTLMDTVARGGKRMARIEATGDKVLNRVNGALGTQMRLLAMALRRAANKSGDASEIKEAELAEQAYADHVAEEAKAAAKATSVGG